MVQAEMCKRISRGLLAGSVMKSGHRKKGGRLSLTRCSSGASLTRSSQAAIIHGNLTDPPPRLKLIGYIGGDV
jgi:hypothetical protein